MGTTADSDLEIIFAQGDDDDDDDDDDYEDPLSVQSCDEDDEVDKDSDDLEDDELDFVVKRKFEDDFEDISILGEGGFGKVFKARHRHDKQYYAVKMIELSDDLIEKEKQLRECRKLAEVHHPGIVRYYSSWIDQKYTKENESEHFGSCYNAKSCQSGFSDSMDSRNSISDGSCLYIQMELCGETLKTCNENDKKIEPLQRKLKYLKVFLSIVDALSYMHDLGLMHRDLKPDNIFQSLKDPGLFKIGDWGSVKENDTISEGDDSISSVYSSYFGTHGYMAPEIGKKLFYDALVDVFSLGRILLELVFPHKTVQEMITIQHKFVHVEAIYELGVIWPRKLDIILFDSLSEKKSDRPPTNELRHRVAETVEEIENMMKMEKKFGSFSTFMTDSLSENDLQESRLRQMDIILRKNGCITIKGKPGMGKASLALKFGLRVRSEGYITLLTDLTNASDKKEVYRRMLKTLKTPWPDGDVDSYIGRIESTLNEHISSRYKFVWVLKNCDECDLPNDVRTLSCSGPDILTIMTTLNEASVPVCDEIVLEGKSVILQNLKNVLKNSNPDLIIDPKLIIQEFTASEQKMLLVLSFLPEIELRNETMYMIFQRLNIKRLVVDQFIERLIESGVLKRFSENRMDLHWHLKELIIRHSNKKNQDPTKRSIITGVLRSLVQNTCKYLSKNGKKLQETDITYIYFNCFICDWGIGGRSDRAFSIWKQIAPIVLYHAIKYLDLEERKDFGPMLEFFRRISLKYPYSEKGKERVTYLLIQCLIADNERRLGKIDHAHEKAEHVLKEILDLKKDSEDLFFLQSYIFHLKEIILYERRMDAGEEAGTRYNLIINCNLEASRNARSVGCVQRQSKKKVFSKAKLRISYSPYYVLYITAIQLRYKVRSVFLGSSSSFGTYLVEFEGLSRAIKYHLGNHIFHGRFLKDYGDFLLENQQYDDAVAAYLKAREIYAEDVNSMEYAMLLQNLGETKCSMGNVSDGVNDFERAMQIIESKYLLEAERNEFLLKLLMKQSSTFYRLYMERGLKGLGIATSLNFMSHKNKNSKQELEDLLGQSIVKAYGEGFNEDLLKEEKFRRGMCNKGGHCCSTTCFSAHTAKELRR